MACQNNIPLTTFTILVAASVTLNSASGSLLTLTASDQTIQPFLTDTLTLTCSVHDTAFSGALIGRSLSSQPGDVNGNIDSATNKTPRSITSTQSNAQFVTSMFIFKDNQDIASVSEHVKAQPVGNHSNMNVSGSIPGAAGDRGFLEVTISYPTESQVGNFTCKVSAIDDVGHPVIHSVSLDVGVTEPRVSDLVKHIHTQALYDKHNSEDIKALKLIDQRNQADIAALKLADQNCVARILSLEAEVASLKSDLKDATHIEGGSISFGNLGNQYHALSSRSQSIKFNKAYKTPPVVVLATLDVGILNDDYAQYHVTLGKVDTDGFTVVTSITREHSGYYIEYLHVTWLSYP